MSDQSLEVNLGYQGPDKMPETVPFGGHFLGRLNSLETARLYSACGWGFTAEMLHTCPWAILIRLFHISALPTRFPVRARTSLPFQAPRNPFLGPLTHSQNRHIPRVLSFSACEI